MSPRVILGALLLSALIATAVGLFFSWWPKATEPGYSMERIVRYSLLIQNRKNRPVHGARFSTFAPVERTPTQKLVDLEASHPYRLERDAWGNQVLHFRIRNLPPNGQAIVRITARLRLSEKPNRIESLSSAPGALRPSALAPANHPRVRKLARSLEHEDPGKTLRSIHQWAVQNVAYKGYMAEDRGALFALDKGEGDCTEAMSLVLALARANKIPGLGVAGFPTTRNQVLRPENYHNWVYAWPGGALRVADPVYERLEQGIPGYIAFRLFPPDAKTSPYASTQSLFRVEEGPISIRMSD